MKNGAIASSGVGARPVVLLATRSGSANGASLNATRLAAAFVERGVPAEAWSLYSTDGVATPGFVRCFSNDPPRSPIAFASILVRAAIAILRTRPRAMVTFHPLAGVFGLAVARVAGTPVRIASQRNPAMSQRWVLRTLDRIAGTVGLYTGNVCVSPAVQRSYAGYPRAYRRRITVIWNGIPDRVVPTDRPGARAALGLPAAAALIGTVGRLDPQKNQQVLIDCLALLPGVELAIAGDGGLRGDLVARARDLGVADRLHLLGNLQGERVPEVLAALDVFVFPSVYEGFGLALVEAMQAGLPCVVSDIEVFSDILANAPGHRRGIVVPPDSADAWAAAVTEVLAGTAGGLGVEAAARARDFRFAAMADQYLRLVRVNAGRAADAPGPSTP